MVTKDVNLGTVLPLALFLVTQTVAGVWWAASISVAVDQLRASMTEATLDYRTGINKLHETDLRQWTRISGIEANNAILLANQTALTAKVENVSVGVSELKYDIRELHQLIRQAVADAKEHTK